MTLRDTLIGSGDRYNYSSLCIPNVPCRKKEPNKLVFYPRDEPLPLALTMVMGLQHAFAMVGGLITPPLTVFRYTINFNDTKSQQYAISAALITSGICTLITVSKTPIPFSERLFGRQLYIGSGVLSVMGVSFTFLPIYQIAIAQMIANGIDGYTAYGKMLGTSIICGLLPLCISVSPSKWIASVFPPVVTSITVMLIGAALIGEGIKSWGGGNVCAQMVWQQNTVVVSQNYTFPPPSAICQNGDVFLGYGDPHFIGLGVSVMIMLVLIEIFGSTFMKNVNVILALLFGYMVSGIASYDGHKYVDTSKITEAEPITFLWVNTYPLGFYGPAFIPCLIAFLVTATETVGDITATYEVSDLDTTTQQYRESVQGGLTADGLNSILAGLFTSMPNTTFAQNNGVISLTKCASRRAGWACGCWLIILGVLSKIAGIITSIPDSVIGGMTIFLFANVTVSGLALASQLDLHSRRIKFIMAMSLAVGLGVTIWPYAFLDWFGSSYTANFWRCGDCSAGLKGIRNGVSIFLSTGYCVGTVIAMFLNFILPIDAGIIMPDDITKRTKEDSSDEDETNEHEVKKPVKKEEDEVEVEAEEIVA